MGEQNFEKAWSIWNLKGWRKRWWNWRNTKEPIWGKSVAQNLIRNHTRSKRILELKSSVWNSYKTPIFRMGINVLLLSAGFQTKPLTTKVARRFDNTVLFEIRPIIAIRQNPREKSLFWKNLKFSIWKSRPNYVVILLRIGLSAESIDHRIDYDDLKLSKLLLNYAFILLKIS